VRSYYRAAPVALSSENAIFEILAAIFLQLPAKKLQLPAKTLLLPEKKLQLRAIFLQSTVLLGLTFLELESPRTHFLTRQPFR
jgi:hypothetical protein